MQDFHDSQNDQVRKLAKFDLDKIEHYNRLSIYEFLDHIRAVQDAEE